MIKVNLINAQTETERIIRHIERGNDRLALQYLADLKKRASSRLRYAEQKLARSDAEGIDLQLLEANVNRLKVEQVQTKNAIQDIRDYLKNPEAQTYKEGGRGFQRVSKAFQRLSYIEERKEAQRETVRQAQKQAGTVIGVTLNTIRKSAKINALFENVLYNNSQYNFNKEELIRIADKIKRFSGFDVMEDFYNHFNTAKHYESGGSENQQPLFDTVIEISEKLRNMLTVYKDSENFAELEKEVNKFLTMARTGG